MSRLLGPASLGLSLALALTACGDGDELVPPSIDSGDVVDAGTDAPGPPMPTAIFVGGDFGVTGVFSRIDVAARTVQKNALAGVAGGEPWVRRYGGELFIINRAMGENITIVGGSPLAFVDQFGTGGGSNPQDVAVVGQKLYVPALGTAGVVVIDRATRRTTTLSLASLDPDGKPDCVSAYTVGTRVFVACGLLTSFVANGPGKVVVIDTTSDTVATMFDLPERNPTGLFVETPAASMFGGDLLISTAPAFNAFTDGCVARVRTTGTPAANGCAVRNSALGGYATRISIDPAGTKAWLAVGAYSADFSSETGQLRTLDLTSGELSARLNPEASIISDVAACPGGYQVASEKAMGMTGVRVYQDGAERTTTPLDVGRPPNATNGLVCW